jgi:hypothetical protein
MVPLVTDTEKVAPRQKVEPATADGLSPPGSFAVPDHLADGAPAGQDTPGDIE